MRILECQERHSGQLSKYAVALLENAYARKKLMFCLLLTILVLLHMGCRPAADGVGRFKVKSLFELGGDNSIDRGSPIFADNRHLLLNGKVLDVYADNKENNEGSSFRFDYAGTSIGFLPPGRNVLIVLGDNKLEYIQNFGKVSRVMDSLELPPGYSSFLAYSDGAAIFNDYDKGILFVDAIGKQIWTIPSKVFYAAYSSKGKFLVASDGNLWRWDLGDKHITLRYNRSVRDTKPMPNRRIGIGRLAISPDGANIAVISGDKFIRLLNAEDGSVIRKFAIDPGGQNDQHLLYTSDGKRLISIEPVGHNAQPSLIRLWDVEKGEEICPPWVAHKTRIIQCCLSPDNSLLATGSYDGSLIVWKLPSLTPKSEEEKDPTK